MRGDADGPSRVAIRYVEGCLHWLTAYQRLNEVLEELGHEDVTVALERVDTVDDARRLEFTGSPTLRIDDHDPFAGDAHGYGISG